MRDNKAVAKSQQHRSKSNRFAFIVSPTTKRRNNAAADAEFLNLLQWRNDHRRRRSQYNTLKRSTNGILKAPKLGVQTIPMTLREGSRVYICHRSTTDVNIANNAVTSSLTSSAFQSSSCLGVSMRELNRRVIQMKRDRIRLQLYPSSAGENSVANGMIGGSSVDDLLWVDKHAPSSFPQLLSDERTNREVLRALRAWDPYVFGRQQPARPKHEQNFGSEQRVSSMFTNENKENGTNAGSSDNNNAKDQRPSESRRVIMLSGPPGVGKRTKMH